MHYYTEYFGVHYLSVVNSEDKAQTIFDDCGFLNNQSSAWYRVTETLFFCNIIIIIAYN